MRNLRELDTYRMRGEAVARFGGDGDENCGAFTIPSPIDKAIMVVIAAADQGWDHVSVSRKNRCPNWAEMEYVFRLFFRDGETAMQLHVPRDSHINHHPYVLHVWRPHDTPIPIPPSVFV